MTLVEVLVAMGILIIGMSSLLLLFNTAVTIQRDAAERSDTAILSAEVMALVRDRIGRELAAGTGERDLEGRTFEVPSDPRYRYRVQVQDDPSDPSGKARLVRVLLVALRDGAESVHDLGVVPVVPRPGMDAEALELNR